MTTETMNTRAAPRSCSAAASTAAVAHAVPSVFGGRGGDASYSDKPKPLKKARTNLSGFQRRAKRSREVLPSRIIPFENHDKAFHEQWYEGRDLLDIPHPFRMLLAAKPNGGKTTVILNIILRVACGKDPFEKIVVVHCDPNTTQEYKDVEHELRPDIPKPDDFNPLQKTLCILEDLNYIGMGKQQRGYLERLVGYASTHKNVSVMVTAQDPFRILPTVRRCVNVFVLWNNHDQDMLRTLARKTGKTVEALERVLTTQCQDHHDSVWIDLSPDSPAPFRKNGYERLSSQTGVSKEGLSS